MIKNITLTEQESKIFTVLIETVKTKAPNTVIRAAGGWVRDKLLGLESHDIDIAIDNMSGQSFAKLVNEYMAEHNIQTHEIAIIEARPEQSKHLETAELKIFGLTIDFVNLRKENYAESRIPTIEFGTPEEDALRRDLTINALFYNIIKKEVEDFTGKGFEDLANGLCRTPLPALQTFIDDPLRVLRVIRFASKYNFDVAVDAIAAAQKKEVHEAFESKISKERIWSEMIGQEEPNGWKKGFLIGPNPIYAIRLIEEMGFRDILFYSKNFNLKPWNTDQNSSHHDLDIWEHTVMCVSNLFVRSLSDDGITYKFSEEDMIVRFLAMLFHDIGKCDPRYCQHRDDGYYSYLEHEVGSAEITEEILTRLNAPTHIKERVIRLVGEHMRLHQLPDNFSDKSLRKFLRDLDNDWSHSIDLAISDACGKLSAIGYHPEITSKYEKVRERIPIVLEQQNGQNKIERPINGYNLMEIGIKPGPLMGKLFAALDEQLLENPAMTKEEAIEFIKGIN